MYFPCHEEVQAIMSGAKNNDVDEDVVRGGGPVQRNIYLINLVGKKLENFIRNDFALALEFTD